MSALTNQENAILLASRDSYYAQSASQYAKAVETSIEQTQQTLDCLVTKRIFQGFEGWTTEGKLDTVYGYDENDYAQLIYNEFHRLK